ncbi:type 1 glutamine amidotransferase domain-containing protein [Amycolatopsis sp. A133]|uniref:type 1 glutamine amidotransferase domain-containing protein n=1 Tax=Amycolatopsis sp. A133 TaxID=3064472 RepID=UPI0027EC6B0F|nr:type 1 glutamine amidotransferase domain-containing protein [Amycolatopsis sp. A133]MDQ7809789.1 type 1 glutamine amidotransferase domain-containing protein [Amycolatopsis sp. A133]
MSQTITPSAEDNRAAIAPDVESKGRVAILTADQVEDTEFFYPYYRFWEAGYQVDVLTPTGAGFTGYKGLPLKTGTRPIEGAQAQDYDALFVPGGLAPGELRKNEAALDFVRAFATTGRPVAALCHGPQVLISAGLAEGRRMTSWRDVAPEVRAAGATYVDEPTVEDGQFITARKPGDMPVQMHRLLEVLDERREQNDKENA